MGFEESKCREAIKICDGDENSAVNYLLRC